MCTKYMQLNVDRSRKPFWRMFGIHGQKTPKAELLQEPVFDYSTVSYNKDSQKFESENPQDVALMNKFNSWFSLLSAPYSNNRDIEMGMLWLDDSIPERLHHSYKYLPRYSANINSHKFMGEKSEILEHIKTVHLTREALDHLGIFVYDVLVIVKKQYFDLLEELRDSIIKTMKDPNLDVNDIEVRFYLYQGMRMLRYIEFKTRHISIDWKTLSSELPLIPIPPKFNLQTDLSSNERIELNSPSLERFM